MHAVAGSVLILAAAILIAATRLASKMNGPFNADEGMVNLVLIGGALVLGAFGVVLVVGDMAGGRGRSARPVN